MKTDQCQDKVGPGPLGNSQDPIDGVDHTWEVFPDLNE